MSFAVESKMVLWAVSARNVAIGALLTISGLLFGCGGGFEAIKPTGSNEDLVYRFNHDILPASVPFNFAPREMPSLPPGSQQSEPLAPSQTPQRTVDPEESTSVIVPLKDGDVMLADISASPYNRIGRLEMRHPSDAPGWGTTCTAQLIGPHGVLLTAAHCIFDKEKREWPVYLRFKLQYDQGSFAQEFDWECAAMVSGWPNGDYRYDYALLKLRGAPPGGLGMTINVTDNRVDAVGYPSKYYNAQRLVHVFGVRDTENPSGMLNDMGKGSSGGARILHFDFPTDVVSVNSFHYTNDPSRSYGPVLNNTTMKVYDFVARSCRDSVPAGGVPLAGVSSLLDKDESETVQARLDVSPAFGAAIAIDTNVSCSCERKQGFAVRNESARSRLISVQRLSTFVDSPVEVDTQYFVLEPNETRFLGCARTDSATGQSCSVDNQYKLLSDRRLRVSKPDMPKISAGVTMEQVLAADDIAYCSAECGANNNDVCLNLGVGAVASLAPLAKFVNVVDAGGSVPNGTLTRKDDVIKEFGGDPIKVQDVCERGDIIRAGPNAVNDGFGCLVTTKELIPNAGLRTRLNMRANVRGTPTTWGNSVLASLVTAPATFFTDRELAPAVDFENNPIFTESFGGDVHGASIVNDKQIVLATSNGCIVGHYRKP
ncbi:trypsin-like serine peptidase [Paracoccus sp. DMF]|uniref:trypsin-like serine peptidase n=1 Tax=Paracoccus sp. DMF TaxID=400837 RepID=UPI0021E4E1C7|nr:serine protease [Paracoccus sp. DMF]MCV2449448.1 serine protease [Paracoccus sp. DMF]